MADLKFLSNKESQPDTEISGNSPIQDSPFYNVMPKNEIKGPMIDAKIKTSQIPEITPKKSGLNFNFDNIKEHKSLVAVLLALLLLAYPVYFLINKFAASTDEQSLLSEEALKLLESVSQNQPGEKQRAETKTTKEWQTQFFGNESCVQPDQCGDEADPERDGLKNLEEFEKETDPNNSDSDGDGLSDGDEVYIFASQPNNPRTASDPNYNDGDYAKGGYNPLNKGAKFTFGEIIDISAKMKASGLHQPTITTLGESLLKIYKFSASTVGEAENIAPTSSPNSTNPLDGFEHTAEAKQDRDTQRSNSIKNIAIALVKYFEDKQTYPLTTDFKAMFDAIKIFTKVATNPQDPINKDKYIYVYISSADGKDFTLTFFSESQSQIIRTRSSDAKKYLEQEQAAIYDDQRKNNLETLRTALLLYSSNNAGGNQEYVFPLTEDYQTSLVPEFITEIPKDPKTRQPYEYQVSETFDSFTLKAILEAPPTGRSGYLCNQEECRYY